MKPKALSWRRWIARKLVCSRRGHRPVPVRAWPPMLVEMTVQGHRTSVVRGFCLRCLLLLKPRVQIPASVDFIVDSRGRLMSVSAARRPGAGVHTFTTRAGGGG